MFELTDLYNFQYALNCRILDIEKRLENDTGIKEYYIEEIKSLKNSLEKLEKKIYKRSET